MNNHLRRILKEDEKNRADKRKMNRFSLVFVAVILAVFFIYSGQNSAGRAAPLVSPLPAASAPPSLQPSPTVRPAELPWELLVVNRDRLLPEGYAPALVDFGDGKLDERVAGPLTEMIAAASESGVELKLISGYRSVEEQSALFEKKLRELREAGFKPEASVLEAEKYLQPPGASEHHTGLGLDILNGTYYQLNEGFAETEAYLWLKAHAAEYGFVERYPKGKEALTGVEWEPWHYRYIGKEFAAEIGDSCLEEFVGEKFGSD